ncbi:MAG: hypothetical protein LBS63_03575 [Prevotellaceae bacterium]|jgi:hypothetical protein|nr:hypothetical protein [Prevotellaceae bacterium]
MKKTILAICVGAAMCCAGCEEETTQTAYSFGVKDYHYTGSELLGDLPAIENYLSTKGVPNGLQVFTGKDDAANDKQAAAAFDAAAAKLSIADIEALSLASGTTFSYACSRYKDASNPDSEVLVIGEFKYPAE